MKLNLTADQWDTLLIEGLENVLSVLAQVQRVVDEFISEIAKKNNGKKRYVRRRERVKPNDWETLPTVIGVC